MRDKRVKHKTSDEGTKDSFHTDKFHHTGTQEEHHHYKDVLNDTVVVITEEVTCYSREKEYYYRCYCEQLQQHKNNEPSVGFTCECSGNNCQNKKGQRVGNHCSANDKIDATQA